MKSPATHSRLVSVLSPLLIALAMFVLIRLSHDTATNGNYFNHSVLFILSELVSITAATYLGFYLTARWVRYVLSRRLPVVVEYIVPSIFTILFSVVIMMLSHYLEDRALMVNELVAPCVVAVLVEIWVYLWLKSSALDEKYHESLINAERIRNEQLITEMKLLQAQYHPHFLFNMLNTIYFRIDESNQDARDAVEHLSNLLRGQLYPEDGKVALDDELSVLESYIELSRMRFGERLNLSVTIDNASYDTKVYPYLLLPLVENAFKHVGGAKEISINFTCDSQQLMLSVRNTIDAVPKAKRAGNGIGLQNLRRRLELFYGDGNYLLEVSGHDGWFNAKLVLALR